MGNEAMEDRVKALWQRQPAQQGRMSRDQLALKAAEFDRRIHRRNAIEYAASTIVVVFFAWRVWFEMDVAIRIGGVLMIAGVCLMVSQLYRRTSMQPMPMDLALTDCLSFHRRALERQRDALRSVWLWYVLPFWPGFVVLLAAQPSERPLVVRLAVLVVFTAFVLFLNARGARQLQRAIDELNMTK